MVRLLAPLMAGIAMLSSAVAAPNIVFIMADDLGVGDTGVTGQNARMAAGLPAIPTPNIDAIANAGVQFRNLYAGGPTCSASRAALLTGQSIGRSIVQETTNYESLRGGTEDWTWGQTLESAGYATGMFGKWHVGGFSPTNVTAIDNPAAIPTQKGFATAYGSMTGGFHRQTVWTSNGTGGMATTPVPVDPTWPGPGPPRVNTEIVTTDQAVSFIRTRATGSQPFAAYVPFNAPHEPLNEGPLVHPYTSQPWPTAQKNYAGMIWQLDQHVGRILAAIDDPNGDGNTADSVADNTIVVFTSDHGPQWPGSASGFDPEFFNSNGPYTGYKGSPQAGGVRTPFFVRWNGVTTPGTVNDSYVGFADVLPTFAALTGQDAPVGIDGESFLPLLTGVGQRERPDALLWTAPQDFNGPFWKFDGWAVQVGDWKLVKYRPTNSFRLYNLASDPGETVNLVASRPDLKRALERVAYDEGADREPSVPVVNAPATQVQQNTYFTQYKNWAPQGGSTNFLAAANWSGGTRYDRAGSPEAANWNSGPADNWIATMVNAGPAPQNVVLQSAASVLALELRGGPSTMGIEVRAGGRLIARNGVRISNGGRILLKGGELNTIKDIDVRAGGTLAGEGLVNGQQSVIAGIPEFAGQGLFEPNVRNGGAVVVDSSVSALAPGTLTILGDYEQTAQGALYLDLFAPAGSAGVRFDQLVATGEAKLDGLLQIGFGQTIAVQEGDTFNVLSALGGLTGFFDRISAPQLSGGLGWAIEYTTNFARLKVVQAAASGSSFSFYSTWKSAFGVNRSGDLDFDGDTDGFDFLRWQRQAAFSQPGASTAAPEPAAAALAALAGAVAVLRQRRGVAGAVRVVPPPL